MSKSEQFIQLEKQLAPYKKIMGQATDVILDKEVSNYPIMVIHQQEIELGMQIYDRSDHPSAIWSIHASTLEEFVSKSIIDENKIAEFTENYKDPQDFICMFVLSELGANFIYLPRK